jgi:hypothetical protein
MGATYLSLQLRMTDRDAAIACLGSIAAANAGAGLQFYVTESIENWLAVFPNFTPELERTAKTLSARLNCLVLLLLSFDEDDLYLMFFRNGKQLPWFKVGVGRKRTGKERDKMATKLEALAEVCDAESRGRLVSILTDTTNVTFASDLLRSVCEIAGVRNAFTSFDYLSRGERDGLETPGQPTLVPG